MRALKLLVLLALVSMFAACGGGQKALRTKTGGPVNLQVFIDPGIRPTTDDQKASQLNQVASFMTTDLLARLKRAGYQATLAATKDAFAPADDTYLLIVTITAYNAGNKAARMLVGGGAGAASLAIHYDLFETQAEPFAGNDFVSAGGSGPGFGGGWGGGGYGDWDTCARDVDGAVLKMIRKDFEKKLGTL